MKGKLSKSNREWIVTCNDSKFLLHPQDVKVIESYSAIFDNIEARISASPDVDFHIVEICQNYGGRHVDKDCTCKEGFKQFAKLKKL